MSLCVEKILYVVINYICVYLYDYKLLFTVCGGKELKAFYTA